MKKIYNSIRNFALALGTLSAANLGAQSYCVPTVSFPTTDDDIAYVMFGSMSNTTTCGQMGTGPNSVAGAYANYTGSGATPNTIGSVPAPVCVMGMNYPLSVGLTMCNSTAWSGIFVVFIDYNQNGSFADPGETVWTSPYGAGTLQPGFTIFSAVGGITIPFSAVGGLTRMRVWESETSVAGTSCSNPTWGEVEDYLINIVPPTPCNNTPTPNTVLSTTSAICPGAGTPLQLTNSYTVGNLSYTWSAASNSVGPFVAIPNATNAAYSAQNLTVTTWYQLAVSCPGFGSTTLVGPNQIQVAATTTNSVPYYETFEGIASTNQLPNCSWTKSNAATCLTYTVANNQNRVPRNGSKFASFYYSPAGTNYFYTNGIQLYAGVTYSAAMWYTTEYYSYNTWNLAMTVGPNQSTLGAVSIASNTYAASPNYKSLSNTFTVATSGLYYVGIRAISNGVCCGYYLSWDDLSITIPCSLNMPTMTINSAGSTTICQGQTVNLSASGLDTYTWSTNANTSSISDMPSYSTTYMASGTNTITNCTAMATKNIVVNPTPQVNIVPSATAVCDGSPVHLIAFGATNYTWSTANTGPMISVSPTGAPAVTYTVLGSNAFNCIGMNTQVITVNPLPAVTAQSDRSVACVGEPIHLTGGGADEYKWMSNTAYLQGSPVSVNPAVGVTTYSLTGTDANGCKTTVSIVQQVFNCVGINEHSSLKGLSIYPNPNNGTFNIELKNGLSKTIEIVDVSGRTILTENRAEDLMTLNINNLANGIYYVKVKSDNAVEILKVVKQ